MEYLKRKWSDMPYVEKYIEILEREHIPTKTIDDCLLCIDHNLNRLLVEVRVGKEIADELYEINRQVYIEKARKRATQIWDLKEAYSESQKENERLTTQLDTAKTKEERLTQIIQILSEAFKRQTHLPSATAALAWSKEAETMPYGDMKVLEIMLENIEKEVI